MKETLHIIDTKALKTMLSDILNRATLINSATMSSWPCQPQKDLAPLYKEIPSFLWTCTVDSETIQKRRLVALKTTGSKLWQGRSTDTASHRSGRESASQHYSEILQENKHLKQHKICQNSGTLTSPVRMSQPPRTCQQPGPDRVRQDGPQDYSQKQNALD